MLRLFEFRAKAIISADGLRRLSALPLPMRMSHNR